ncbi:hypothetical protein A3K93_04475 [Acinetobacter sp. NCu2D-2]|uniref:DUF6236 family protein n=1 Tax=Acinetobacter sp. NCu2D-2 TaxID=1608473 RepID=UPI0007CDD236|nr:DUF6236 family protein [Acinetobacter sp. NCu2D-2]ANF81518.1 hypothetical protein A3K93_04475 [Acinetobacter sp. NCu2D-2]
MSNIIQFKKRKLQRGIVAPAGIMSISGSSLHLERTYNLEDIYYYVMYWDRISIPTSNAFYCGLPLEKELFATGMLERPSLPIVGTVDVAQHTHFTFGEVAKNKMKDDSLDWMIHHMSGDPIYLPEHTTQKESVRLKITKALPIPSVNAKFSLDDLLSFKVKRSSELEALHETMDKLLKKIHYEEIDAIRRSELIRFENAIQELDRTIFERFKVYKKSDFEVNLDLKGDAHYALALNAPTLSSALLTDEIQLATLVPSIMSLFTLTKKYGVTFNQYNHGDLNLEYLSSARSENIIF